MPLHLKNQKSLDDLKKGVYLEASPSKYRSIKTTVDNIVFASQEEAIRYSALKMQQHIGEISNLNLQVRFYFVINEILICAYDADFTYYQRNQIILTVEDSKGFRTRPYQIKKKLMRAIYGIIIKET